MSHPASRRVAVLALALATILVTPLASSTTYSFRVGSQGLQGGPAPVPAQAVNIAGGYAVNLRTAALAAGWDGTKPLVATVTANIGSTATTTPGLTISGSFPNGVKLVINSGVYVVGAGGSAGGTTGQGSGNGGNGGTAISVATPVTITNNGVIGGGAGMASGSGWERGTLTNGGRNGAGQLGGAPGETGNYQFSSYCSGQGGSGGGLGAAGGRGTLGQPGAGGAAVVGNTNVTWATPGTRYGAIN